MQSPLQSTSIETSVIISVGTVIGAALIGYFKMYVPVATRLTSLEARLDADECTGNEQRKEIRASLEEINNKLDSVNSLLVKVTTTIWGEGGTNGLRGSLNAVSADVKDIQRRMVVLETNAKQS